jgi:glutaredoxin 3
MVEVVIYSTMWCPFCARAKALLNRKGARFTEIDVDAEAGKREEMVQKAGGRTSVPQIFIGGKHVGGCDELYGLERERRLDPMLAGA